VNRYYSAGLEALKDEELGANQQSGHLPHLLGSVPGATSQDASFREERERERERERDELVFIPLLLIDELTNQSVSQKRDPCVPTTSLPAKRREREK